MRLILLFVLTFSPMCFAATFPEAVVGIKAGQIWKRAVWPSGKYIKMGSLDSDATRSLTVMQIKILERSELMPYMPSKEAAKASDWEVQP